MTTRRGLLAGAAAAIAAPLLPLPSQAATVGDAAIFALAERRQFLDATATEVGRIGDNPSSEVRDASERRIFEISDAMTDIEDEMSGVPAETVAGAIIKLKIAFTWLTPSGGDIGDSLAHSALADLERIAACGSR